jgi:hypothetical protein
LGIEKALEASFLKLFTGFLTLKPIAVSFHSVTVDFVIAFWSWPESDSPYPLVLILTIRSAKRDEERGSQALAFLLDSLASQAQQAFAKTSRALCHCGPGVKHIGMLRVSLSYKDGERGAVLLYRPAAIGVRNFCQ